MRYKTSTFGYSKMAELGCFKCRKCAFIRAFPDNPFKEVYVFCTLNEVEIELDISFSSRCLSFQKDDSASLKSLLNIEKKLTFEVKR